jgi:RimJ/RimL family protein N-acetyltransferase
MQPFLDSSRLLLRPYTLADAPEVQRLASDRRVAEPTAAIPHPYPAGAAQAWIATHADIFSSRRGVSYAVILKSTTQLVGTVSLLDVSSVHARAEVGYWVGFDFWGRGLCAEALACLLDFGYSYFAITRFIGRCVGSNPASARVLEKCGFNREGVQVKHVFRSGRFDDMVLYGRCHSSRHVAS